jgi:hypothetical protein
MAALSPCFRLRLGPGSPGGEWMQYSCEIEVVTGYKTESLTKGFESWEVFMLQTIERDSQNKSNNGGLGCQWKKKIGRPG